MSQRVSHRVLFGALLLASTLTAGCGQLFESDLEAARNELASDAMQLQLVRTSAAEGELVPLKVTLTNTSSVTVEYEGNTCPWSVFEVQDAAGERIDPRIELILCLAYSQTKRLAPGESDTWSLQWPAARYAPSTVNRASGPQTVRIRARYWLKDIGLVASAWQSVVVTPGR